MAPGVEILLYCRLRYFRLSLWARAEERSSALLAPRALPWRFSDSRLGHFSINFEKISRAMSVSSLKERSKCLSSCIVTGLPFHASIGQR